MGSLWLGEDNYIHFSLNRAITSIVFQIKTMLQHYQSISFSNGQQFVLKPTDIRSVDIISQLQQIINLPYRNSVKECFIEIGEDLWPPYPFSFHNSTPFTILLPPIPEGESFVKAMKFLVRSLAFQTIPFCGLLLHGALLEYSSLGIILIAKSGIGKSTGAGRIPPPWKALSDEATLVVKKDGQLYAHPFPTWSKFQNNGDGGTWDVEYAVPVKAIFQLQRSQEDFVEPLSQAHAITCLFGSAKHALGFVVQYYNPEDARKICCMILENADEMVKRVPVHMLNISLTGKFWEKIERFVSTSAENYLI